MSKKIIVWMKKDKRGAYQIMRVFGLKKIPRKMVKQMSWEDARSLLSSRGGRETISFIGRKVKYSIRWE